MAAPAFSIPNSPVPAEWAAAVTPSDSVSFTQRTRGIYVGGAGNISVHMADGSDIVFNGALAGSTLPICCLRVNATSTTATNLVALF